MNCYRALSVANYFIEKAREEGTTLTPMKLMNLVYLAHGWCLGLFNEPLVNELIEARQHGPIVSSVYHRFKRFGNNSIPEIAKEARNIDDMDVIALLKKIWKIYGDYSAFQLSNLTHEENSPWDIVWNQCAGWKKYISPIDNGLIREHYFRLSEINKKAMEDLYM